VCACVLRAEVVCRRAGRLDWLTGNQKKARHLWQQTVALCDQQEQDWVGALTMYELGRFSSDRKERTRWLHRVVVVFNKLNVFYLGHPHFSALRQLHAECKGAVQKVHRVKRSPTVKRVVQDDRGVEISSIHTPSQIRRSQTMRMGRRASLGGGSAGRARRQSSINWGNSPPGAAPPTMVLDDDEDRRPMGLS
jgi:hypothetical protein